MIDLDEIRKAVAIKHGILLDKNDPVLVTAMLNEALLEQYVQTLDEQNRVHQEVISNAMRQAVERSKEIAGVIITQSAEYVSDQINNAVNAALEDASERNKALLSEVIHVRNEARYYVIFSFLCAVGAGISAAIASY